MGNEASAERAREASRQNERAWKDRRQVKEHAEAAKRRGTFLHYSDFLRNKFRITT